MHGHRFFLDVLRVSFDVPFFARSITSQGLFLHRSTSFFGDERIELRCFSTCMEGRFPHSIHFESFFSLLDQRPFLAESISSHRLFSAGSVLFNIRCYKPVALFSVIFCTALRCPNFRLIAPSHFKLIASFLIRLVDNFKYFLFSDIYDIHTYMHTLFSHIRF